jgi:hypothetical protein
MAEQDPLGELDPRFSSADARVTPWAEARDQLDAAKTNWLSTVRPDGRPHVTTIAGIWLDQAVHFVTGRSERKAKNLAQNTQVVVTTGSNGWDGLDVVVEGEAVPVTDPGRLRRLVEAFTAKYDDFFGFRIKDGRLEGDGLAYEVSATKVLAFRKGASFSQTRWLLQRGDR